MLLDNEKREEAEKLFEQFLKEGDEYWEKAVALNDPGPATQYILNRIAEQYKGDPRDWEDQEPWVPDSEYQYPNQVYISALLRNMITLILSSKSH